jgi:hypothetical protein
MIFELFKKNSNIQGSVSPQSFVTPILVRQLLSSLLQLLHHQLRVLALVLLHNLLDHCAMATDSECGIVEGPLEPTEAVQTYSGGIPDSLAHT